MSRETGPSEFKTSWKKIHDFDAVEYESAINNVVNDASVPPEEIPVRIDNIIDRHVPKPDTNPLNESSGRSCLKKDIAAYGLSVLGVAALSAMFTMAYLHSESHGPSLHQRRMSAELNGEFKTLLSQLPRVASKYGFTLTNDSFKAAHDQYNNNVYSSTNGTSIPNTTKVHNSWFNLTFGTVVRANGISCNVYLTATPAIGPQYKLEALKDIVPDIQYTYNDGNSYSNLDPTGSVRIDNYKGLLAYLGSSPCQAYDRLVNQASISGTS